MFRFIIFFFHSCIFLISIFLITQSIVYYNVSLIIYLYAHPLSLSISLSLPLSLSLSLSPLALLLSSLAYSPVSHATLSKRLPINQSWTPCNRSAHKFMKFSNCIGHSHNKIYWHIKSTKSFSRTGSLAVSVATSPLITRSLPPFPLPRLLNCPLAQSTHPITQSLFK